MENLEKLSDQNLYSLCKTYGSSALEWRRKFTGLLPEVNRRKLFEKKGFESIFVFAKKLAGLSEEQVRLTLNLEKKFTTMPILKNLLTSGEVSINKLARITSIANQENEKFLAKNIKFLSKNAVETMVRDNKIESKNSDVEKEQNGLFETKIETESLPGQTLNLSTEVHQKLLELQQKGLDVNQILLEFLQKRELEIAQKKEQIREKVLQKEKKKRMAKFEDIDEYILEKPDFLKGRPSLSVATKKILHEEFGTKCAIKSCQKSAENIHHTLPFSLGKTNDPKFLVPLCKEHHELEHVINTKYQNSITNCKQTHLNYISNH